MAKMTMKHLAEVLEGIQAQLAALTARVEQIEHSAALNQPAAANPPALQVAKALPPEPAKPEISEDELIAVSAALAAYLGVRVRIRQIRLLSSHAWAQQGRVSIQASHNLHG
jgi:methylmalonyl-CoA carboxyltransferase large subunit